MKLLRDQKMEIAFPQMPDMEELLTSECYRALQEIRDILKDDTLSDKECFEKIENIVCVFEKSEALVVVGTILADFFGEFLAKSPNLCYNVAKRNTLERSFTP